MLLVPVILPAAAAVAGVRPVGAMVVPGLRPGGDGCPVSAANLNGCR